MCYVTFFIEIVLDIGTLPTSSLVDQEHPKLMRYLESNAAIPTWQSEFVDTENVYALFTLYSVPTVCKNTTEAAKNVRSGYCRFL